MERIKLKETDDVFIRDGGETAGCGSLNYDGKLYYFDTEKGEAFLLPEKYQQTQLILYHPCGGYNEGLIMVSLLGELNLQYHHTFSDTAGMWGWIDLDGNEVIPPQYVYAMKFFNGMAIVCKGDWSIDDRGRYWCENEQWGIIDKQGNEIMPCAFDELFFIDNTDRFVLCHQGGWENGCNAIFDLELGSIIVNLDFSFDDAYMFNECFFENGNIFFCEHDPGEELDRVFVFSTKTQEWILKNEIVEGREFNGQTRLVVNIDGQEIVVF